MVSGLIKINAKDVPSDPSRWRDNQGFGLANLFYAAILMGVIIMCVGYIMYDWEIIVQLRRAVAARHPERQEELVRSLSAGVAGQRVAEILGEEYCALLQSADQP